MKATCKHLLVEYQDCDRSILNKIEPIEDLMNEAAIAAKATVVNSVFHRFSPQGISGVVVIEESHMSVHTWPEHGYAAVDFFTCGECDPEKAHEVLLKGLKAKNFETMMIKRGSLDEPQTMNVVKHKQKKKLVEKHELDLQVTASVSFESSTNS